MIYNHYWNEYEVDIFAEKEKTDSNIPPIEWLIRNGNPQSVYYVWPMSPIDSQKQRFKLKVFFKSIGDAVAFEMVWK